MTLLLESHSKKIKEDGWAIIDRFDGDLEVLMKDICEYLDIRINSAIHAFLSPKKKAETTSFNLSSVYGLSPFPLHSDGTHFKTPPRFFILRALSKTPTKTFFIDTSLLKKYSEITDSVWKVNTVDEGIIDSSFFNSYKEKEFVRYNNLSMVCIKGDKAKIFRLIHQLPRKAINWNTNRVLIVDNWRILHGRQQVQDLDYKQRVMERVQFFV